MLFAEDNYQLTDMTGTRLQGSPLRSTSMHEMTIDSHLVEHLPPMISSSSPFCRGQGKAVRPWQPHAPVAESHKAGA